MSLFSSIPLLWQRSDRTQNNVRITRAGQCHEARAAAFSEVPHSDPALPIHTWNAKGTRWAYTLSQTKLHQWEQSHLLQGQEEEENYRKLSTSVLLTNQHKWSGGQTDDGTHNKCTLIHSIPITHGFQPVDFLSLWITTCNPFYFHNKTFESWCSTGLQGGACKLIYCEFIGL